MAVGNPNRFVRYSILACLGVLLLACTVLVEEGHILVNPAHATAPTPSIDVTSGSEPLVPTALPPTQPTADLAAMSTPSVPTSTVAVPSLPTPYSLRWRAGVGVPDAGDSTPYRWLDPRPGWYLNWHFATRPQATSAMGGSSPQKDSTVRSLGKDIIPDDAVTGIEFVPMVYNLSVATTTLERVVGQLPGRTWLLGNEPDVRWQGNLTPEAYAAGYHRVYTIIKRVDPTASVAMGSISQVTPLRLAYLDRVLDAYVAAYGQPMPVDVWNIHTFVLQEKRDDWGVDIPPGFDNVDEGELWTIEEHNDVALVEEQVIRMRHWMLERGEQNKPLWITEYGILMPAEYGFPPEVVAAFMTQTFDLFQTLRDPQVGLAADDYRLVQRWVWFSTDAESYPTGNLFAHDGEPTFLMQTYSNYLAEFGP